jgi:hypothetical protein
MTCKSGSKIASVKIGALKYRWERLAVCSLRFYFCAVPHFQTVEVRAFLLKTP